MAYVEGLPRCYTKWGNDGVDGLLQMAGPDMLEACVLVFTPTLESTAKQGTGLQNEKSSDLFYRRQTLLQQCMTQPDKLLCGWVGN